jgi:hypothetical protein
VQQESPAPADVAFMLGFPPNMAPSTACGGSSAPARVATTVCPRNQKIDSAKTSVALSGYRHGKNDVSLNTDRALEHFEQAAMLIRLRPN